MSPSTSLRQQIQNLAEPSLSRSPSSWSVFPVSSKVTLSCLPNFWHLCEQSPRLRVIVITFCFPFRLIDLSTDSESSCHFSATTRPVICHLVYTPRQADFRSYLSKVNFFFFDILLMHRSMLLRIRLYRHWPSSRLQLVWTLPSGQVNRCLLLACVLVVGWVCHLHVWALMGYHRPLM